VKTANLKIPHLKWTAAVGVLLVAAWFRTHRLETVPPGPHFDAIINAQIVEEFIWPTWPAWLRPPASSPNIPWLAIQANPNGPDLQEHAWLYQVTLAASMGAVGRNVMGMRFPDLAWGMMGVAACYALGRRLFGRSVALLAMAVQAVSFWSIFLGRAGLRAGTIVPVLALAGCAFWDAWQRLAHLGLAQSSLPHKKKIALWVLAGTLLGLSIYGYLSARPMVVVFLAIAVYLGLIRRVEWRKLLPGLAAFLASAALVAAPLLLYNWTHPEANLRFNMVSAPLQDLLAGRPAAAIWSGLATLGMFAWRGDTQWHYNVAGRPVFDPLGAALFIAGIGWAVWHWRHPANLFALIWLGVSLAPGALSTPAPHFTRVAAAQAVAYAFVGLGAAGLTRLTRRTNWKWLKEASSAGLAMWLLGFAAWNYHGYFDIWANNEEVRFYHQSTITEMARYLDRRADTTPVAACSIFIYEREDFFRSPRQTFAFILRRKDLPIRWFDCRLSFVIPAGGRARLMFPAPTPYSLLSQDFAPWMEWSTPIHDDLLPDGTLHLLDVARPLATELISLTQTSLVEWGPEAGVTGRAPLPVDFDHALEFLGYQLKGTSRPRVGREVRVLLYWRVKNQPPIFLVNFVHLLSDPYHIVAQSDGLALLADTLQPGDVFIQLHYFTIPEDTPAGAYRLSTGWYSGLTQHRLLVYEDSVPRGDRLMLQEITVRR